MCIELLIGPGAVEKPLAVAGENLNSTSAFLSWNPPPDANGVVTMYIVNLVVLSTDPLAYMGMTTMAGMGGGLGDRRKRQTPGESVNVNCVSGNQQTLDRNFTTSSTSYTVSDLSKLN